MSELLAEVKRSGITESAHRGTIVVVTSDGKLQQGVGDPATVTFFRSAAKPVQAIPLLTSGAAEHFGFGGDELAVMVASHSGEYFHVKTVTGILEKIGASEANLSCGAHPPLSLAASDSLVRAGREPGPLHNNCSGKHAGMLALCRFRGYPLEGYYKPDHPVQAEIRHSISAFTGIAAEQILVGVDGCGVPVFAIPLANMALAYARLCDSSWGDQKTRAAANQIIQAMTGHPLMVGGTGRLDTMLMQAADGALISKSGAEGVQCLGLPGKGIGIALKIEDGSGRAAGVLVLEVLEQLGILSKPTMDEARELIVKPMVSPRGEPVGSIDPVFGRLQALTGKAPGCP